MSFLHFFSSKHRVVSGFPQPSPSDWQEKSQFGGFLAHVLQRKPISHLPAEGQLSCPGCHQGNSAAAEPQDWPDTETEGRAREKGNYMLGFAGKMNLPAVPEPLGAKGLSAWFYLHGARTLGLTPVLPDPCLLQQLGLSPAVNPGACSDFKPRKICSRGRN